MRWPRNVVNTAINIISIIPKAAIDGLMQTAIAFSGCFLSMQLAWAVIWEEQVNPVMANLWHATIFWVPCQISPKPDNCSQKDILCFSETAERVVQEWGVLLLGLQAPWKLQERTMLSRSLQSLTKAAEAMEDHSTKLFQKPRLCGPGAVSGAPGPTGACRVKAYHPKVSTVVCGRSWGALDCWGKVHEPPGMMQSGLFEWQWWP